MYTLQGVDFKLSIHLSNTHYFQDIAGPHKFVFTCKEFTI